MVMERRRVRTMVRIMVRMMVRMVMRKANHAEFQQHFVLNFSSISC